MHCRGHPRRRVKRVARATRSPVAEAALTRIGALRAVEKAVRGRPPEVRRAARRDRPAPLFAAPRPWLEAQPSHLSSGSKLAEHIRLTPRATGTAPRASWATAGSSSTCPVETLIRPIALTRTSALFAGHEVGAESWALLASLLATCTLDTVDPAACVAATLEAIINGHPQSRIDDLRPRRSAQDTLPPSRAA